MGADGKPVPLIAAGFAMPNESDAGQAERRRQLRADLRAARVEGVHCYDPTVLLEEMPQAELFQSVVTDTRAPHPLPAGGGAECASARGPAAGRGEEGPLGLPPLAVASASSVLPDVRGCGTGRREDRGREGAGLTARRRRRSPRIPRRNRPC